MNGRSEGRKKSGLVWSASVAIGLVVALAIVPGLGAAAPAIKWTYHAGDAFLAGLGLPTPDVAKAANGDTVTIAGTGTFNPGGPATGLGTFTHRDASGKVLASGTWTAVAVVSYETFGNAVLQGLSNKWFGGTLVLSVSILPSGASSPFSGTLTVNCALGTPPAGVDEGIMLSVPAIPITFDMSVSGVTLFVLTP